MIENGFFFNRTLLLLGQSSISQLRSQGRFPRCPYRCRPIPSNIPANCISRGRVHTFRGRLCRGCDWISRCVGNNALPYCYRNCPRIPQQVPRHCVVPGSTVTSRGRRCRLCDRVRPMCSNNRGPPIIPRCSMNCREVVNGTPGHCVTQGSLVNYHGRPCRLCDAVDFACVRKNLTICADALENCQTPQEGMPDFCLSQNVTSTPTTPPCLTCPVVGNSSRCTFPLCQRCTPLTNILTVPPECIKKGNIVQIPGYPYKCSLCPYIDPFCAELEVTVCGNQMANCVGVPIGTPAKCIDQSVHIFLGNPCLSCPVLKTETPGCVKEAYGICPGLVCPRVTRQTVMCFDNGPFSNTPNATCKSCPILHRNRHRVCTNINSLQRF